MTEIPTKIALFMTSEIFDTSPFRYGEEPVHEFSVLVQKKIERFPAFEPPPYETQTFRAYSTGNLERALEQGYEVFVLSRRIGFSTLDFWWRKLVKPENVYLATIPLFENLKDSYSREYQKSERDASAVPWRKVARLFGVADQIDWSQPWTDCRIDLTRLLGAKLGPEFEQRRTDN